MSHFKFLVIIFSFFLSLQVVSEDALGINSFLLSKEDLRLFKIALKEGDKAKWRRTLNTSKKIKSKLAVKIIKWRWLTANDGLSNLDTLKKFHVENSLSLFDKLKTRYTKDSGVFRHELHDHFVPEPHFRFFSGPRNLALVRGGVFQGWFIFN